MVYNEKLYHKKNQLQVIQGTNQNKRACFKYGSTIYYRLSFFYRVGNSHGLPKSWRRRGGVPDSYRLKPFRYSSTDCDHHAGYPYSNTHTRRLRATAMFSASPTTSRPWKAASLPRVVDVEHYANAYSCLYSRRLTPEVSRPQASSNYQISVWY